jgi:hypothetical protein
LHPDSQSDIIRQTPKADIQQGRIKDSDIKQPPAAFTAPCAADDLIGVQLLTTFEPAINLSKNEFVLFPYGHTAAPSVLFGFSSTRYTYPAGM